MLARRCRRSPPGWLLALSAAALLGAWSPARVTGVDFEQVQGLHITSWSVREGQQHGLGSSPKDLAAEGFPQRPAGISLVCGGNAGREAGGCSSELGTRLELAGARGTATVLRVLYTMGERRGVVNIPISVEMASV